MERTDGVTARAARPARTRVLVVIVALAAWATGTALAQGPSSAEIVADVVVHGNRTVPTDKIMRYLTSTRIGTPFSYANLHKDAERLQETGLFRRVSADRKIQQDDRSGESRLVVYFVVDEFPNIVQEVIYKNAHHISQKELDEMTRVKKGMPMDPTLNKKACFEILDHLRRKGRYFANVTLEEGRDVSDKRVVFNISEGPIVRVRSLGFRGHNELASGARLSTQIDSSRPFLYLIGGVFNPGMVDSDVLKIEEYYRNNGYLTARATRELRFSDDFQWVDITYHIHEGQHYRIKSVGIEGTKQLGHEQVSSILRARAGEHYNEAVVAADMKNITDLYGWRGYPVQVNRDLYEVEPGVIRVQYQVQESQPFRVGQVIIVGNEVTQDRVIRRMLDIYPGQILQFPQIRRAEAELARLNIFEMNPELGTRPQIIVVDGAPGYKDLVVQVKETKTGSLLLGGGINSDNGFFGSIVLHEKNFDLLRWPTSWEDILESRAFRGAGQELRIEAVPGTELQRYSISFREPYLFDLPYSLTASGFYWDRVFDEYVEGRTGGRLTLGHMLTRSMAVNVGARIENIQVSNVSIFAPMDYHEVSGANFQFVPRVGAVWDNTDSILRPTEGGKLEGSFEYAVGDFNFPIFNVEGARYFTVAQRPDGSGKQVVALRSTFAWAGSETPVYERFFAGGYRSIRGFRFRGVGPRDNGFAVGGDFMFLNSIEYQLPIRANDQLYAVAFVDSGTVERELTIRDYRVSAGFGLRIMIPQLGPVPLALDFGFPIVRGDTDREQVFSFWIGLFR